MSQNSMKLKYYTFKVESDLKEEFLLTLIPSTRITIKGVLIKIDKYEEQLGKSFYDFNFNEIDDFIESAFKNKSIVSVRSTLSYLKKYIDFCISKNLVSNYENRINAITNPERYVDKVAMRNKYIDIGQLQAIIDTLINPCDKLLVHLLFLGVKPSEITNLKNDDIDFVNKKIYLHNNKTTRELKNILPQTFDLLNATINQKYYFINNGCNKSRKRQDLEIGRGLGERTFYFSKSCYIFKTALCNKTDEKIRKNIITERIRVIRCWGNFNYITPTSIRQSGIIYYAYTLQNKNQRPLSKEDYILICNIFGDSTQKPSNIWQTKELVDNGLKYLYN